MSDLFEAIFDVPSSGEPHRLLGLAPGPVTALEIDAALSRQLRKLVLHPRGNSAEAMPIRGALLQAADVMRTRAVPMSSPQRPGAALPLTNFDRHVLATLVAHGGWNARSRARLVGLASTHGVRVEGLIKVIRGLADYARAGGPRLSLSQITAGEPRLVPAPPSSIDATSAWLGRVMPEIRGQGGAWGTARLAAIGGLIGLVLAGILALALLRDRSTTAPQQPVIVESAPRQPLVPTLRPDPESSTGTTIDTWPTWPTIELPQAAIKALNDAADHRDSLDALAAQLAVGNEPDEAAMAAWQRAIGAISAGWVLFDDQTLASLAAAVDGVLIETSASPAAGENLLAAITPSSSDPQNPLDQWTGAWKSGTLARVAATESFPPALRERAANLLAVTPAQKRRGGAPTPKDFSDGAAMWLSWSQSRLVASPPTSDRTTSLHLWLMAAQKSLRGEAYDSLIWDAVQGMLLSPAQLPQSHEHLLILARLLEAADFDRSSITRERLKSMLVDEHLNLPSQRLWVLTSLLARRPGLDWFRPTMIVPAEATMAHRRRNWESIERAWRTPASGSDSSLTSRQEPPRVSMEDAAAWKRELDRLEAEPARMESAGRMQLALAGALLNEAAVKLWRRQPAEAARVLEDIDLSPLQPGALPRRRAAAEGARLSPPSSGQAIGEDGRWAAAYQNAGVNGETKVQMLEALRQSAGTDLGPIDAQLLVRETFRGRSADIRAAAARLLTAKFARGPVVLQTVLDQLPEAPLTEHVAEVVGQIAGRALPSIRTLGYWREARLAMLDRLLQLRPSSAMFVDQASDALADSMMSQTAVIRNNPEPSLTMQRPEEAAARLVEAWRMNLVGLSAQEPYPATLSQLDERRRTRLSLAAGPIQAYAALRLSAMELLLYETAADGSVPLTALMELHRQSAPQRAQSRHALDQTRAIELTMARIWRMRFLAASGQPLRDPLTNAAEAADQPAQGAASAPAPAPTWQAELTALGPDRPAAYFELGEIVADEARDEPARELSRQLLGLAGQLDPARFGRSACLALADMERDDWTRRRLRTLAAVLGRGSGAMHSMIDQIDQTSPMTESGALAVSEAFSLLRIGEGAKAQARLERDSGAGLALLQASTAAIRGGAGRFLEDCKHYRQQRPPNIGGGELTDMLRLEQALLAGDHRSWAGELMLTGGAVLMDVDPDHLEHTLPGDSTRPYWRNNRWTPTTDG